MSERIHLSPRHREEIASILRRHVPNVEVWAYGSRVTGRSHDASDLDLVLRAQGGAALPIGQLARLADAFSQSNIPFFVEARDWARIPESFRREIDRHHVVIASAANADVGS